MDGSDSISDHDWSQQKNFVANLINNLEISPSAMHASVIVFSTLIGDIIDLTPFKPKQVLLYMARVLSQPKVGTNTAKGINKVRELLRTQGRKHAPKIAVVITDGRSVSPKATVAEASLAKSEGITVIAVGVGTQIFTEELSQMATSPQKHFEVSDFSALQQIVVELRNLICQGCFSSLFPWTFEINLTLHCMSVQLH